MRVPKVAGVFAVFAWLFGLAFAAPARAEDLIVARAAFDDPSRALSIAEVVDREFAPVVGATLFREAVGTSAHWVRLRVRPPAGGGSAVLYILPAYLNEVRLFEADPADPQRWKSRVTGSDRPFAERDRPRASLGFVVTPSAPETTYYLRFETSSQPQLNVKALAPQAADDRDRTRDLAMTFFATAMLALLVWALEGYLRERQRIFALFAVHQAVYLLFGLSATGHLAAALHALFGPLPPFGGLPLFYLGIGFAPLVFCRELFKPYAPSRRLMRGIDVLLCALPLELGLLALGRADLADALNALVIKLSWVLFVAIAFTLGREQSPSRRVLRTFFVIIAGFNVMFWLANHGILSDNRENLDGIKLLVADGLVIGGLFAVILHARGRQVRNEAQKAKVDFLVIREKLALERELKEQIEAQARTDYLTGVFNRRHFVELAERELERAQRYGRPFTLLMIDIDHFKALNDTHGHGTGDAALQTLARVIGETLRGVDIFGRLGGEEFAAVLVETGESEAAEIANRICKAVAETEIAAPAGGAVRLTVSIGVAQPHGRATDFDAILNAADQAMYAAKQGGRNRVALNGQPLPNAAGS